MPLSTKQIKKLATLFQSKQEADHKMAQSLVESLCDTQEDFESLFFRHKRHLSGGMPSFFGRSIVWAYGFYAEFEDSPLREWETIEIEICGALPDYLLTWPNLKLVRIYGLSYLDQLEWLDTTGEDAAKWVEILEVGNLTKLNYLDLGDNQITTLPQSFGKLNNLTYLDLRFYEFTTLPDSIGNLNNLTFLSLSNNQLTTFPDWIGKLTKLNTLYLGENRLATLPESIGNLNNLTSLYLWGNQLTTLSESITNLTNLTFLDLSDNPISAAEQERIRALLPNCDIEF